RVSDLESFQGRDLVAKVLDFDTKHRQLASEFGHRILREGGLRRGQTRKTRKHEKHESDFRASRVASCQAAVIFDVCAHAILPSGDVVYSPCATVTRPASLR